MGGAAAGGGRAEMRFYGLCMDFVAVSLTARAFLRPRPMNVQASVGLQAL